MKQKSFLGPALCAKSALLSTSCNGISVINQVINKLQGRHFE